MQLLVNVLKPPSQTRPLVMIMMDALHLTYVKEENVWALYLSLVNLWTSVTLLEFVTPRVVTVPIQKPKMA